MFHCCELRLICECKIGFLKKKCVIFLRYTRISEDAGSLLTSIGLRTSSSLVRIVESVSRKAVELLDALQVPGGHQKVQQLRGALLSEIQQTENAQVGAVKFIVELAHVIETSLCVRVG
jgi:hypothetical protein